MRTDTATGEFAVWWEPPELLGTDRPEGAWVVAEQDDRTDPPLYGDELTAGPIDASEQWLAAHFDQPRVVTREDDFEIGIYARHPDGTPDHSRIDRWITAHRYTITIGHHG